MSRRMETIDALEAQARFEELLERASRGETFIITKGAKPLARLVPTPVESTKMTVEEAIAGILAFRKEHSLKTSELLEWIREGRGG